MGDAGAGGGDCSFQLAMPQLRARPEGQAGHAQCSPPSLHVASTAGLEGAQGASAAFSTLPRLPDRLVGLGFDSTERTTYPFPISHPSRAGAWKLPRPPGAAA